MKYLILGASAAGISGAKAIREQDSAGEITIISQDQEIYSRCMLHYVISDRRTAAGISFIEPDFLQRYHIRWVAGQEARGLNTAEKTVRLVDGTIYAYDRLLIATGASSFLPPITNLNRGKQVYGLRTMTDVRKITAATQSTDRVTVIGAGLVGMDAAYALAERGLQVTVIEMAGNILPLQLDRPAAGRYEKLFRERGVEFFFNQSVVAAELDAADNVQGVKLKDGQFVPAGMLVVAAGVRANTQFLQDTAVELGRGIKVNEYQQTSVPDVFAAGDVCESVELFTGNSICTPIWPAAVRQGQVAGCNMAGVVRKLEGNFAFQNSMNFFGVPTVSFGLINPPADEYQVVVQQAANLYQKFIFQGKMLRGAILQGDISQAGLIGALIKNKLVIAVPPEQAFDLTYADFFAEKENGAFYFRS